jgi:hypothetical protein
MSGTSASLPVATTTAWRAVSTVSPTATCFSPVIRPCPRTSPMPALSTQLTCPSSDQLLVKESRRPNTAVTSSSPVTAWAAP